MFLRTFGEAEMASELSQINTWIRNMYILLFFVSSRTVPMTLSESTLKHFENTFSESMRYSESVYSNDA